MDEYFYEQGVAIENVALYIIIVCFCILLVNGIWNKIKNK